MNEKLKGYVLACVAAASYGMNPLFALPLYADGMNADSVLFFRYLFAIPVIGLMAFLRGRSLRADRRELPVLLIFGLVFALSSLTLFTSYNYMDAGIASTLLFIYPILVALIMYALYREKISRVTTFCMLMALLGIGLLYKGKDGATLSLAGTLIVFLSSLTYAVYMVGVNKSKRLSGIPTLKITFYVLLAGFFLFGSRLAINSSLCLPSRPLMWFNILALSLLPTVVSLICTTRAVQYIGSTPTAIMGALEPATAIILGVTVFGEQISLREWFGLSLIIVSVSLVVAGGENLAAYLNSIKKMFPKIIKKDKR